jgi:alcohol dehydrogenase
MAYQFISPELRVYQGENSLQSLQRELERAKLSRAVVICGRTVGQSAAMQHLQEVLSDVCVGVSATAREHSPVPAIDEAADFVLQLKADAILAVGGGSAAVTARAVAIQVGEKKPLAELSTRRRDDGTFDSPRLLAPKLPIFAIPTTPSTAFAKAGTAIHSAQGERLAMFDPKTRAKAIFIHTAFVQTAPDSLVQSATWNALANAVEALEAPRCDPFSEALLMQALRLIRHGLTNVQGLNAQVRESLVAAALLCGRGTEQGGTGLASVMAHAIGSRSHVANGIVNAIVLPHTMAFNAPVTQHRASAMLDAMGLFAAEDRALPSAHHVRNFLRQMGAPSTLREIGVQKEDLAGIAQAAMADWSISRNPRPVQNQDELVELLEQAW